MRYATEIALIVLQGIQVLFLLVHDWIPLGRLSNLSAVRAADSTAKLLRVTAISALPYAVGFIASVVSFPEWPMWLHVYLEWLYAITLAAAVWAWWIPYLSPSDSPRAERYRTRFAGTLRFLPQRHGFAPDVLHTAYHAVVIATLVLLVRP